MNEQELMQELLQSFRDESVDHLETLNQSIMALERHEEGSDESMLIQEAFRAAHSLKGAARAVSMSEIEQLAHVVEDVLKAVRDGDLTLTPYICDRLYDALDTIQMLTKGQEREITDPLENLRQLLPEQAAAQPAKSAQTAEANQAAQTAQPSETSTSMPISSTDETIRVALHKLDTLMAQIGELTAVRISAENRASDMRSTRSIIQQVPHAWHDVTRSLRKLERSHLDVKRLRSSLDTYQEVVNNLMNTLTTVDTEINRDAIRLGMLSDQLQDEMRRVRMLPFSTVEPLLQRTTRDAARQEGKQVSLTIIGGDVELDKKVLELLHDPLLHLVRNAIAHGIELPAERGQAGKAPEGKLTITVNQRGSEAHILITDDGGGFKVQALRVAAQSHGIELLSEDDPLNVAFISGISTNAHVTTISGRGVGLDVVRQQVQHLQGRINVQSDAGQGAEIELIVPVSLAMMRVLLVKAGIRHYALPLAAVDNIIEAQLPTFVENEPMIQVGEEMLHLLSLAHLLNEAEPDDDDEPLIIILGSAEQRIALLVGDVLTEQELAMKPFSPPIERVRYLSGAALMGNGQPIIVLNTADIVQATRDDQIVWSARSDTNEEDERVSSPTIEVLVVDDSITTRTLEKNILQAAGFLVQTATNGLEALEELRKRRFALMIADVEMPKMDGITLTQQVRNTEGYEDFPIILVTSLESPADRERGMAAGANAYIVKRGFNQSELLATIRSFI